MIGNNAGLGSILSFSGDANVATSYLDNYRIQGKQWVHQDVISIPNGVSYFVLDFTPAGAQGLQCIAVPSSFYVPEGPVQFTLYEGTDYTGTTDMLIYNPERVGFNAGSYTRYSTLKSGGTGSTLGTKLRSDKRGTAGGFFTPPTGGASGNSDPTTTDTSKKYLFVMNNTSGGAVDLSTYISWFEI